MQPGQSFSLHVKGTNRFASYTSSDFKVASVSLTGKVSAHRTGMAIITVSQEDEEYTCKVTVIPE